MKTPQLPESEIREILSLNGVDLTKVSVLAVRGYYRDTMGEPGKNDVGIYDDAHFVVWPDGIARFQANTDPSRLFPGVAVLDTGVWAYGTGTHKSKKAFRGVGKFAVIRIRASGERYRDFGYFAINWHSGSEVLTSSLGCQTNPPAVWAIARPLLYRLLPIYDNPFARNDWGETVRSFPYVLINESDRRSGNLVAKSSLL